MLLRYRMSSVTSPPSPSLASVRAKLHRTMEAAPSVTAVRARLGRSLETGSWRLGRATLGFLSTVLNFVLVLASAIFLYGTFYYAYMPVDNHTVPVSLQFEPCEADTLK